MTEGKVKFDFTRVGRSWSRDFLKSLATASRAQLALQRLPSADATDDEIDALWDKQEQALADLEQLSDVQAGLLCQVLVDVPNEWLIEGAPDNIDWGQVDSLDWIQADRYTQIFEILRTRNVARDDSKNSRGHTRSQAKRRGQ